MGFAVTLILSLAFGVGVLLLFDGLTRPRPSRVRGRLSQVAPRLGALVGGAAAGWVATGWVAAGPAGALIGYLLPGAITARRTERLAQARREALAEAAARLRDAVRAGLGISEGLALVARSAPSALGRELKDLATRARTDGLGPAGERFANELDDPLADLLARALFLADRLGSAGVVEVLDGLADAASGLALTTREVRARQLQQKLSARVVAAVPIGLLLAIRFANPEYLAPYARPQGQLVLAFGFALIGAGYWAMVATARIPGAGRERGG